MTLSQVQHFFFQNHDFILPVAGFSSLKVLGKPGGSPTNKD